MDPFGSERFDGERVAHRELTVFVVADGWIRREVSPRRRRLEYISKIMLAKFCSVSTLRKFCSIILLTKFQRFYFRQTFGFDCYTKTAHPADNPPCGLDTRP